MEEHGTYKKKTQGQEKVIRVEGSNISRRLNRRRGRSERVDERRRMEPWVEDAGDV